MIDEAALPDAAERFEQAQAPRSCIVAAGYERDRHRPFRQARRQPGHRRPRPASCTAISRATPTDRADALIGLGASSIGQLPQGYVQNIAGHRRIRSGSVAGRPLAKVRGSRCHDDDRLRGPGHRAADVRFLLLAQRACSSASARRRGRSSRRPAHRRLRPRRHLRVAATHFVVTDHGKPFVRSIAATFDAYLGQGHGASFDRGVGPADLAEMCHWNAGSNSWK